MTIVSNILQAKEGITLLMSVFFRNRKEREWLPLSSVRETLKLPGEEFLVPKYVYSCTISMVCSRSEVFFARFLKDHNFGPF